MTHKKYPKIPTVNLSSLRNSCAKIACCSSEFIFAFLYAGSSIQNASEQFLWCIHISSSSPTNKDRRQLGLGDSDGSVSVAIPYELFPHKDRYCHTPKTVTLSPESPCISNCEVTEIQIACSFEDVYSPLQLLPSYQEPNSLRLCTHSWSFTPSQINSVHNGYTHLCVDARSILFSRGDQSLPERERTGGAESDDAPASTQAVWGVQGDFESAADSRVYRHAAAACQSITLTGTPQHSASKCVEYHAAWLMFVGLFARSNDTDTLLTVSSDPKHEHKQTGRNKYT